MHDLINQLTRQGPTVIPADSEAEFHAEHDGVYRFPIFCVWHGDITS
jgi:hypothetical protein